MNMSMGIHDMDQQCTSEKDHLIMSSYLALVQNTMCCDKMMPIRFFTNKAKSEDVLMEIQLMVQEQSQFKVTSPP